MTSIVCITGQHCIKQFIKSTLEIMAELLDPEQIELPVKIDTYIPFFTCLCKKTEAICEWQCKRRSQAICLCLLVIKANDRTIC